MHTEPLERPVPEACSRTLVSNRKYYFAFFVASGFCSILYEIVWIRIAMARFGVTTPMVSIVLSAFMLGLGLGSWAAGIISRRLALRSSFSALRFYASLELLIGISAIAVPYELSWGRAFLLRHTTDFSSPGHYLVSAIWLVIALVPWCACMGATFPFAMTAIDEEREPGREGSFSYLYLANILGASAGALIPLALIEVLGFHRTLLASAGTNLLLSGSAFFLSCRPRKVPTQPEDEEHVAGSNLTPCSHSRSILLWVLFGTGLTSMGAEVIWIRLYTPFLGTTVYAFATILGMYLVAMYMGTWAYRKWITERLLETDWIWILLGASMLAAFATADPRVLGNGILRVALGIMPFSAMLGIITPAVVDQYSRGEARSAGNAYAVNILGCVLGPLLAGFVLLPRTSERVALLTLSIPWFAQGLTSQARRLWLRRTAWSWSAAGCVLGTAVSLAVLFQAESFDGQYTYREVKRDSTATVVAVGSTHAEKRLLVNGVGMTTLSPNTKIMVHLPLALLQRKPESGLVICFGMGTTHLSMLSWGIRDTAVELVPSVPKLVTFFHPNALPAMNSEQSRVIIDDGRSYLERTSEQYDVITIDPPPPVSAAGSSLLYSKEFYGIAKQHLRSGGIMQQWLFAEEPALVASVARALSQSFPYVRAFHAIDNFGVHFLASMSPIPNLTPAELAAKLPSKAAQDLIEWGPASDAKQQFDLVLGRELSMTALTQLSPKVPALEDDRPMNEYFLVRQLPPVFRPLFWAVVTVNLVSCVIFVVMRIGLRRRYRLRHMATSVPLS